MNTLAHVINYAMIVSFISVALYICTPYIKYVCNLFVDACIEFSEQITNVRNRIKKSLKMNTLRKL